VVFVSGEPLEREPVTDEYAPEKVALELRVGHLLRIGGYLDYAILSMWTGRRAQVVMGMAEASVRGTGPGSADGPEEELLVELRDLIREAREHHAAEDLPAAMARMRVAEDLVALRIIRITGE
jgi:hypothetical protein